MLYATTGKSIEVVTFCRTFAYHGSATTNGGRHATPISRELLEALKTCPFYYNLLPHHYANVINFINSSLDQHCDNTTGVELDVFLQSQKHICTLSTFFRFV